jgi:hypothetical protein
VNKAPNEMFHIAITFVAVDADTLQMYYVGAFSMIFSNFGSMPNQFNPVLIYTTFF